MKLTANYLHGRRKWRNFAAENEKKRMMNSLSLLNAIIIRLQGAAGSDKACM